MGRASKHKKPRRRAGQVRLTAASVVQAESSSQFRLVTDMLAAARAYRTRCERYAAACQVWCSGREPEPAPAPWWVRGTLGRRFIANPYLDGAREAVSLLTAEIPPAVVIAGEPAHWHVAANALVRAVVFDGLEAGHPVINGLVSVLVPIAETELRRTPVIWAWFLSKERRGHRPSPAFPILDGPVKFLGRYIIGESARAVAGSEPGDEEVAVLSRALDGTIPGVAGSVVADALIHDANPFQILVASGALQPSEVLGAGLAILQAFVSLVEADAENHYRRAA